MRKVLALAALALASCGGNAPTSNEAVTEESEAAGMTAANDTTAIDAVTGQAANMAADVNFTINEQTGNETAPDEPAMNNSAD